MCDGPLDHFAVHLSIGLRKAALVLAIVVLAVADWEGLFHIVLADNTLLFSAAADNTDAKLLR